MGSREPSVAFDCSGGATDGEKYNSISEMWEAELSAVNKPQVSNEEQQANASNKSWYEKSAEYWEHQSASLRGMLGGLEVLDSRDVNASHKFLDALTRITPFPTDAIVLDVGAGIGRVTKHLLAPRFGTVDMLEQNPQYLQESLRFIGNEFESRVGKRIACGMQNFCAEGVIGADGNKSGSLLGRYHLVWIQWCIIYLTDEDLVGFLQECKKALVPGGIICLKDNVARSGFLVDKEDSSVMRSDKYLKHLFTSAGLQVFRETKQVDFPRNVFPVRSYALRPMDIQSNADLEEADKGRVLIKSETT